MQHHPNQQSNGEAERGEQTAKRLIKSSPDLSVALLAYCSTPLANGYSPAELLYGRQVRTALPTATAQHIPKWPYIADVMEKELRSREQQEQRFNSSHRTRDLPEIPIGTKVWLDDIKREGTVVSQISERSNIIATTTGNMRHNRHSIKVLPPLTLLSPATEPAKQSEPATTDNAERPSKFTPQPIDPPTLHDRTTIGPKERLIEVM